MAPGHEDGLLIIKDVSRADTERVWVAIINSDGQTLTSHHPVFKFGSGRNASSVSTNEGGRGAYASGLVEDDVGGLIGLVDGDIADGDVGLVQTYGYHESALIMRIPTSVTVRPGHSMGPGKLTVANSVGVSSTGVINGHYGPIVALDTVTATMHSLGVVGRNFCNHVFLRCL